MRSAGLAALVGVWLLACTREEPAPVVASPVAPVAAAPPVTQPAASPPVPRDWWCACSTRGAQAVTRCLFTRSACEALELRLAADTFEERLTHGCREVKPVDLGEVREWKPGTEADSWESVGACLLPGPESPAINPAAADYAASEVVGGFHLGMTGEEVLAVAEPASKGKRKRADYDVFVVYEQDWRYPQLGLLLTMFADTAKGAQRLAGIQLLPDSALTTARGIKLGSTRAELKAAYGELFGIDSSDDWISVSTGDHGIVFNLRDDKVATIHYTVMTE